MKIKRKKHNGWICLYDGEKMVEAICLDNPNKTVNQLVQNHIIEQQIYITNLQTRLNKIKWELNSF